MTGTRNLSAPHTPLVIILPVSTCSHRACAPGKLSPYAVRSTSCGGQYPSAEVAKPIGPTHAAESWFDRKQMLFRLVSTVRRFSDSNDGIVKPISSSHDADSHFASQHMLAQSVRAG